MSGSCEKRVWVGDVRMECGKGCADCERTLAPVERRDKIKKTHSLDHIDQHGYVVCYTRTTSGNNTIPGVARFAGQGSSDTAEKVD